MPFDGDLKTATCWISLVLENAAIVGLVVARRRQAHLAYSHPHERTLLFCVEVREWTITVLTVEAGELFQTPLAQDHPQRSNQYVSPQCLIMIERHAVQSPLAESNDNLGLDVEDVQQRRRLSTFREER